MFCWMSVRVPYSATEEVGSRKKALMRATCDSLRSRAWWKPRVAERLYESVRLRTANGEGTGESNAEGECVLLSRHGTVNSMCKRVGRRLNWTDRLGRSRL